MSIVLLGSTSGSVTLQEPAVAGTTVFTLPATSGTVVVTGTTPSLNGIAFPATQSASDDANTLDDYEEGTWNVGLGSAGATSGQTYSSQDGRYVKVGQMVIATFDLRMSNKGTLNSDILITGLPFASKAGGYYGGGSINYWENLSTNWIYLTTRAQAGGTAVSLSGRSSAGSGISQLQPGDISNNAVLMGTIMYQAAA
jgi:hypothetical protein